MKNLLEIKFKIVEILNLMKGFKTGYTSKVTDKMIVDYNGKRFIVSFEEIKNPADDILEDMDTYLY